MEIVNKEIVAAHGSLKNNAQSTGQGFEDILLTHQERFIFNNKNTPELLAADVGLNSELKSSDFEGNVAFSTQDEMEAMRLTLLISSISSDITTSSGVSITELYGIVTGLDNTEQVEESSPLMTSHNKEKSEDSYQLEVAARNDVTNFSLFNLMNVEFTQATGEIIAVTVPWGGSGAGYLSYSVNGESDHFSLPLKATAYVQTEFDFGAGKASGLMTNDINVRQGMAYELSAVGTNRYSVHSTIKAQKLSSLLSAGASLEQQLKTILPQYWKAMINDETELKVFIRDYFQHSNVYEKLSEWIQSNGHLALKKIQIHFNGHKIIYQGENNAC